MSNFGNLAEIQSDHDGAPKLRKFMAARGLLLVKEFRDFGTVKTEHGAKIAVCSAIVSCGKLMAGSTSFGVRLEQKSVDGNDEGQAFLDFEELDELLGAFEFLASIAVKMRQEERDQTEVTYSTKDNVTVGFLHRSMKGPVKSYAHQQPFLQMRADVIALLSFEQMETLKRLIEASRLHLQSRGAGA